MLQRGVSVDLVLTDAAHSLLRASYQSSIPLAQLERLEDQCKAQGKLLQHAPTFNIYRDADEWAFQYTEFGMPVRTAQKETLQPCATSAVSRMSPNEKTAHDRST